jgi:hypothetical protein
MPNLPSPNESCPPLKPSRSGRLDTIDLVNFYQKTGEERMSTAEQLKRPCLKGGVGEE